MLVIEQGKRERGWGSGERKENVGCLKCRANMSLAHYPAPITLHTTSPPPSSSSMQESCSEGFLTAPCAQGQEKASGRPLESLLAAARFTVRAADWNGAPVTLFKKFQVQHFPNTLESS